MQIVSATMADLPQIMAIFAHARQFMRENGNPTQWPDSYPSEEIVAPEIEEGDVYLLMDGGEVEGTFSLVPGEDSTYGKIEDGSWTLDAPYSTIHRLASWGRKRGLSHACFDFCATKASYLRIDTHAQNLPMQAAIRSYGFRECGIIHIWDGTPRIAFDLVTGDRS